MTFDASDLSTENSQPVELYEFNIGATAYRFTSASSDYIFSGNTYSTAILDASGVKQNAQLEQETMSIRCASDFLIVQLFDDYVPFKEVFLTIRQVQETDSSNESIIIFSGRVLSTLKNNEVAKLNCEPFSGLLKNKCLRPTYQIKCNHTIYNNECGLNKADFLEIGSVVSVNNFTVVINGVTLTNNFFNAGFLEFGNELVTIVSQTGSTFELYEKPVGIVAGSTVNVYPGCKNQESICAAAPFNNLDNYLGFYITPERDIFNGKSIKGDV